MVRTNMPISAEVILKPKSGRSMAKADVPITSNNIDEFRPSERAIEDAAKHLKQSGFAVSSNGLTLTIQGEGSLFENVFNVKLTIKKKGSTGRLEISSDKELSIPPRLAEIVEGVIFVPPPEFFS